MRNIAIIAHVDHGKTTLVDQLFRQSGMFRDNQVVAERLMDSMDLERERGITIAAKVGSCTWGDQRINIIDTPGHADFGGQVERVLRMADAALLLVDAQEGPMPQTYFVLEKALALGMPIIVVVNKVDKPAARPDEVVDEVFDLFVRLDAPHEILDFPIVYASAKEGWASLESDERGDDMTALFETIVDKVHRPYVDPTLPMRMLVSSIDYSPYLGRLAVGRITTGHLVPNGDVAVLDLDGNIRKGRITKVYRFEGNERVAVERADAGDIVAVAVGDDVTVGVTITDPAHAVALDPIEIDPPTIAMRFLPNDSPFAGLEGQFVTSRHIAERLRRETLADVALAVEPLGEGLGFRVAGRGELHLSILIERMRREGYELQVSRPEVIRREVDGKTVEPYEDVTIDIADEHVGTVIEKLGKRKGVLVDLRQADGMARLQMRMPMRGLLGYRGEFLTDTKGMGKYSHVFAEWGPDAGDLRNRKSGTIVVKEAGTTVAYALFKLQDRGVFFVGAGVDVYPGQIIGEHAKTNDLVVNPSKGKKLTNVRSSGTDDAVVMAPPRKMSLEDCIAFLNDDELLEVTPQSIRMRKRAGTW